MRGGPEPPSLCAHHRKHKGGVFRPFPIRSVCMAEAAGLTKVRLSVITNSSGTSSMVPHIFALAHPTKHSIRSGYDEWRRHQPNQDSSKDVDLASQTRYSPGILSLSLSLLCCLAIPGCHRVALGDTFPGYWKVEWVFHSFPGLIARADGCGQCKEFHHPNHSIPPVGQMDRLHWRKWEFTSARIYLSSAIYCAWCFWVSTSH